MDNYSEPRMRNTEVVVKSSQSETYQDFLSVDSDAKKKKKKKKFSIWNMSWSGWNLEEAYE